MPLLLTALLLATASFAGEIRVFKLMYASPDSVAGTCEALFRGQATFAAAPQINALIVNTDDAQLFKEIEKLLAALDRRPATLRFTVRNLGSSSNDRQSVGVSEGRFPRFNNERQSGNRRSERSVAVLEFARARFTDDQVRVFSLPGWYGPEVVQVTTSHGLKVSGHLTEKNTVMVQIWYAQGDGSGSGNNTEFLLTELETVPGQWAEFGGLTQGGGQRQHSVAGGGDGGLTVGSNKSQTDSQFSIRVDVIR